MHNGRTQRGMSRTAAFFVPLAVVGTAVAGIQGWHLAQTALRHQLGTPSQEMVVLQQQMDHLNSQLQERTASAALLQAEADRVSQSFHALDTENVELKKMVGRTQMDAFQLRRSLAQALAELEQLRDARKLLGEKRQLRKQVGALAS